MLQTSSSSQEQSRLIERRPMKASLITLCRARKTAKCTYGTPEISILMSSRPSLRKARCKVGSHISLSTSNVLKVANLASQGSSLTQHRRLQLSGQPQTKANSALSTGVFVPWYRVRSSARLNTSSASTRVRGIHDQCSPLNAHPSTMTCF